MLFPQKSEGGAACFSDLKVGVYKEIVPMGVDPDMISSRLAGKRNTYNLLDTLYNCIFSVPI